MYVYTCVCQKYEAAIHIRERVCVNRSLVVLISYLSWCQKVHAACDLERIADEIFCGENNVVVTVVEVQLWTLGLEWYEFGSLEPHGSRLLYVSHCVLEVLALIDQVITQTSVATVLHQYVQLNWSTVPALPQNLVNRKTKLKRTDFKKGILKVKLKLTRK